MSRLIEIMKAISEEIACPEATRDISVNLANRQACVDKANYGPANPDMNDEQFWQQKANLFKTSVDKAKTMRCKNCAAFVQKEKMLKCIQKGLASQNISEDQIAKDIIDVSNLGYCELFDFKCAGERTCDAWITGGPLKADEQEEFQEHKNELYEMNMSALKIMLHHISSILNSIKDPNVMENLTEPWLQGKISVAEDYISTLHDFVMYSQESDDSVVAADKPGLWENIRKKREKEGKRYRPAKPGDKDRPDPEQWNKLTKKD